mmetsp:Transcript_280/g.566  ORF Transcript_280/g.566 Transcript_280/m.566 type:complete len:885 (-) Transcript_280:46-2700(-)|eukprot:CAMPEP_0172316830 /NCGR_PEP_ID=MMETSP1058-20130122/29660_1 /TAXON_ID=83371 /ORGANISM="Detonula confervacea, Strain CCMP 353" /LENGTH=884 /DNA_ID=CAMNT_0013031245 /DNA_START=166 /DNA_END=2820 /DNA_ORIENTATION=+
MRLTSFKPIFIAISIAAIGTYLEGGIFFVQSSSVGKEGDASQNDILGKLKGVKEVNIPRNKQDRIRVPLGRRLADVMADDHRKSDPRTNTARRFEIEVDNNTPNGAKLMVEEVQKMAVTSQTKYKFHESRNFNHEKIKDIAILASNPKEHEGLTIMSITKSNGDVKGFQRGRTGHTHQISHDSNKNNNKLRLTRSLVDEVHREQAKKWTCETAHAHDDDAKRTRGHALFEEDLHTNHHDHDGRDSKTNGFNLGFSGRSSSTTASNSPPTASGSSGTWVEPTKYSFNVDLSIDIDKHFIEKQGSAEAAVEYINVLVSAANVIYEHEVDAHLNIIRIEEQTLYDNLSTTREALRAQRLHPRPHIISGSSGGGSKYTLHHAMLGRYLGGGIAFIDSICDEQWGWGVTSDISGKLSNIDEKVLFDFFIVTHEIGHSLGSGHTFDGYDPPVDVCGLACTVTAQEGEDESSATVDGLPRENSATIMSYCNFCDGGLNNIAITLGGVWDGAQPKTDIEHWGNHPDIQGDVSVEPWRVSHNIWQKLAAKGDCVTPPSEPLPIQGCNDDNDCDDHNSCTIDECNESNLCTISETLENCCGNGKCEAGEGQSCSLDCGPFRIRAPRFCENCHTLDGFMFDVGLSDKAKTNIFINSISLAYSPPENSDGATIDVFVTTEGSYNGKEKSADDWERITTVTVYEYNPRRETGLIEIKLDHSVPLGIGDRRGFYFAASEDIIMFGEGPYSVRNDQEVELYSSLAVSGLFGAGIYGFSLSCEVSYLLDDSSLPTKSPSEGDKSGRSVVTSSPSSNPVAHSSQPTSPPSSQKTQNVEQTPVQIIALSPSSSSKPSEETQRGSPEKIEATATSTGSTSLLVNHTNSILALLLAMYMGLSVN